jgi:hypothetical protein
VTFSPPCLTAEGGASTSRPIEISCFIGRYSRRPKDYSIQQHPRFDTSTGSFETPDAPRSLCTRNQSSVQPLRVRHSLFGETTKTGMPHQTKLVLRIDGFMHKAILLNATPYQLSWFCTVPRVCTVHLHCSSFVSIWSVVS